MSRVEASTQAFATPGTLPVFPVATANTALPATFAWLAGAVSSAPAANPRRPVPEIAPVLKRFQDILDHLTPGADEGDLSALADEVADWSSSRANATAPFTAD